MGRFISSGGAIAIGHPLGATGARQVATGYPIARETGAKIFVTSMCIGTGMVRTLSFLSLAWILLGD